MTFTVYNIAAIIDGTYATIPSAHIFKLCGASTELQVNRDGIFAGSSVSVGRCIVTYTFSHSEIDVHVLVYIEGLESNVVVEAYILSILLFHVFVDIFQGYPYPCHIVARD